MKNPDHSQGVPAHSQGKPPQRIEEKLSRMGSKAGAAVDRLASLPGQVTKVAAAKATETQDNASRKASQMALDLSARLDPNHLDNKTKDLSHKVAKAANKLSAKVGAKAEKASKGAKKVANRLDPGHRKTP